MRVAYCGTDKMVKKQGRTAVAATTVATTTAKSAIRSGRLSLLLVGIFVSVWINLPAELIPHHPLFGDSILVQDSAHAGVAAHTDPGNGNVKLVQEYAYLEPKVCVISVLLGNYEKSAKEPSPPLDPSRPLFFITDREDLLNSKESSQWKPIRVDPSLWKDDCLRFQGARNNPCDNINPFNLGKFYKTQFHRVPELTAEGCNVVVWLDGSIQLTNATFMKDMASRADRGQNLVVYAHHESREGRIDKEVGESIVFRKYTSNKFAGHPQPVQPVMEQYQHYLAQGFKERWFDGNGDQHRRSYGMYVTCMVMFDLRQPVTQKFLDCWWEESVRWTTQDQVSFPYCAWKLGLHVHALPDAEISGDSDKNPYFEKLKHGL